MLKLITPRLDDFKPEPQATPNDTANNVFKVFHGFYGNLFLSKFVNGQTGSDGVDQGVISARAIWAHGLRDFDLSTVKTALARVIDAHPEFPPTLPQFVQLCKACAPREVYRDTLPPPKPDYAEQAKKAKARLAAMRAAQAATAPADGLAMLKRAIADAVGCAGGDEAAELARLDRMFKGAAA